MSRLSKKAKTEWSFFWNDEIGRRSYNEMCANVGTSVSRVSGQRLSVARNITLKEVSKPNLKVTNSTIRVKAENYTLLKFKSRIKRKNAVFDTLLIQKIEVSSIALRKQLQILSESKPYKYIPLKK